MYESLLTSFLSFCVLPQAVPSGKASELEAQTALQGEFDALLKAMQHELKSISTDTLLDAQLEALKQGWADQRDVSDLSALASKFVLQHNVKPDSRSFSFLLRHGMVYAMQEAPTRLDFLTVLHPFVQRGNFADLRTASVA